MNASLNNCILLAGLVHFFIVAANFILPSILHYGEHLAKVPPIIRQIFRVHAAYIVLVLLGFGVMCVRFPAELAGATPLGRFLSGFLAVFWLARVFLQLGYYDREIKRRHPFGNAVFAAAFLYLGLVFTAAALFGK